MNGLPVVTDLRRGRSGWYSVIALLGHLLLGLSAAVLVAVPGHAQESVSPESSLRLRYIKREYQVPMRDGTRLHTAVYSPRDTNRSYPILLKRTPYSCSPYGEQTYPSSLGPSRHFVEAGYIFVNQDVRGRYHSEGEFVQVTPHLSDKTTPQQFDESSDTYDTIQWLLEQVENHNGRVGMYGISYPGFYCSAGMIDAHPALAAVSPQAPIADWYFDDFIHNGAFFLAHAFRWLSNNAGQPREPGSPPAPAKPLAGLAIAGWLPVVLEAGTILEIDRRFLQGSIPFWEEMMAHPDRDQFWQQRNILPHLKNVAPAVLVVTGWFDAEDLYGSFKTYQALESQNPAIKNVLVVGPWRHGGWASETGEQLGDIHFGSKTAAFYREEIEFPFFEKYLKDRDLPELAEATVFETGANRWRVFDQWPPREAVPQIWYFQADQRLTQQPPTALADEPACDEYLSDPGKPVPFTAAITPRMTVEYMLEDQRFAARRPDVLVYRSEPLEHDLTLAGPLDVQLWISSSGTDADFVVKLIDEFPDSTHAAALPNFQMMVRSEVMLPLSRFVRAAAAVGNRYSDAHPLELQDVLHCFRKGHRLMIQVQSSWFPLVDRNPQRFVPNIFLAQPSDFQRATAAFCVHRSTPVRFSCGVALVGWSTASLAAGLPENCRSG